MGLLDFEDTYTPPFKPRSQERRPTEQEKQDFLNSMSGKELTEDYSDSPFADRI